jgi:hypothetical protein
MSRLTQIHHQQEENKMKDNTYIVYQNSLRKLTTEINRIGSWTLAAEKFPKVNTHLECSFKGGEGFTPEMFRDYSKVAMITADTLNQVFEVGNIGPEDQIKRFKPMHSVSVGDILRDDNHKYFMVDPDGFTEITNAIWFGRDVTQDELNRSVRA